jgi:hypothetical protein
MDRRNSERAERGLEEGAVKLNATRDDWKQQPVSD